MKLEVDSARLSNELETLAEFSDTPAPAITRVVFSAVDMQARRWVKSLCSEAGLSVREDAVGNLFARWEGSDKNSPPVATGSHIDAIPNSGRFDGTVGVLGGLEAIRTLKRAGLQPKRSIELILFTSEEPTRFGIGCLGSRLLSGALPAKRAALLKDVEGQTLDAVRSEAGFEGDLSDIRLQEGSYSGFVELHIEQGPLLEQHAFSIGVVTDIAAPAGLRVVVRGEGGHAGAVLMPVRRDALSGAAEIALAVEAAARSTGSQDSVATTGVCQVFPGAVNSIPSEVKLELDVRDTDLQRRDGMLSLIEAACLSIGEKRKLDVSTQLVNADNPARCHPSIVDAITRANVGTKFPMTRLVSRAYHDSLFMANIAPVGMIFIPCRAGVSHRPDEYSSPEEIERGVVVLARTLADLSSQ